MARQVWRDRRRARRPGGRARGCHIWRWLPVPWTRTSGSPRPRRRRRGPWRRAVPASTHRTSGASMLGCQAGRGPALPLYTTEYEPTNGREVGHGDDRAGRDARAAFRSWPSATCGCTSRGWAPTPTHDVPIIVRGEGCYVWDEQGNRYFDGLSALFCVNIGHGRADVAQAGADQAKELELLHELVLRAPARDRAGRADRRPGARATSTASSSPAAAARRSSRRSSSSRQYHKLTGNPNKTKIIAREIAYHGTTLGALAATGITPPAPAVRAAHARRRARAEHEPFRLPPGMTSEPDLAEAVAHKIEFEGPDTVAAVIMEPVQNAGGCFVPPEGYWQRVREICDEYDVLLISDEVICSWGRLGEWFGAAALRLPARPDHHGQGHHQRVRADGRADRLRPRRRAVPGGHDSFVARLHVRRPPDLRAVSMANIDVIENEGILENVREQRGRRSARCSKALRDIPIVGDVRGAGYFHAHRAGQGPRDATSSFPTRSPRPCCAASSPASCSSAG